MEEIEGSVAEKMDTSDCDLEGEESSCESNLEDEVRTCAGKSRRHTSAQLATLNAYYKFGMVGVGKHYSTLITAASETAIFQRNKSRLCELDLMLVHRV